MYPRIYAFPLRPDLDIYSGILESFPRRSLMNLNPGQLDTGQLDTGHLDTGHLDTGQLDTHENGKVGQLDTSI